MSASLTTANYGLGKYAPDDKTNWLVDFNGNMDKIDAGMEANKQAAAAADEKATNAAAGVSALTETVQGNTDSIEANEKAIAANSASIKQLDDTISTIEIGEYFKTGLSGITKVEPLVEFLALIARRIGNGAEVKGGINVKAGTFHLYDRVLSGGVFNGYYCTDLVRITGNPIGLAESSYTPFLFFGYGTDTSDTISTYGVLLYVPESNFTVLGFVSTEATQIIYSNKINGIIN